jgi:hypothetical protein
MLQLYRMARSSRGLGRKNFFLETEVRILYELQENKVSSFQIKDTLLLYEFYLCC